MAKTRRHKTNRSPVNPYGRNTAVAVLKQGTGVKVNGFRDDATKIQKNKDAKPIWVGRQYTGVNRGKVYPYAGKKRGGGEAAAE